MNDSDRIIDAIRRTKVPTVNNLCRKLGRSTKELLVELQSLESLGMLRRSSNEYFLTEKCRESLLT